MIESDLEIDELVQVIAAVAEGDAYLTPRRRARPWSGCAGPPTTRPRSPGSPPGARHPGLHRPGRRREQTARQLAISEKTVQNIQSRLFRKLGARNRAQAVARAHELGLLPVAVVSVAE